MVKKHRGYPSTNTIPRQQVTIFRESHFINYVFHVVKSAFRTHAITILNFALNVIDVK